ncbi:MAG TPA: transposase [Ilumatobacteraceae bacterium]|nr:transposase [Ilumatobacteraceae bacterium]
MNRGVARQHTFHSDADRVEFGRLLGVGHDRFGVEVHAYCLVPNHYHLLVHCPLGGLSPFMQQLGSVFTRHVNERLGRDGPLFRGRFRSIAVTDDRQLLATTRYIHRNALDIVGVTDVAGYRWSSHRTYLGLRAAPPWLRTETVLAYFAGDPDQFARFVSGDGADERGSRLLTGANLHGAIELVVGEFDAELTRSSQGVARTVAALLSDDAGPSGLRQAACELLGGSPTPAALARARRAARAEPVLLTVADRVRQLCA